MARCIQILTMCYRNGFKAVFDRIPNLLYILYLQRGNECWFFVVVFFFNISFFF